MDINNIQEELKSKGIEKIVAFSGGSDAGEERAKKIIHESLAILKNFSIAVLTGGTKWGVPKYASNMAKDYGLLTIGIFPQCGKKYELETLDYSLEIAPRFGESRWGDETEVYAKLTDGSVMIDGSMGTAIEFAHIMKMNDAIVKNGGIPKYVVPVVEGEISDSEKKFADFAYDLPIGERLMGVEAIPKIKIYNGADAAIFLLEKWGHLKSD